VLLLDTLGLAMVLPCDVCLDRKTERKKTPVIPTTKLLNMSSFVPSQPLPMRNFWVLKKRSSIFDPRCNAGAKTPKDLYPLFLYSDTTLSVGQTPHEVKREKHGRERKRQDTQQGQQQQQQEYTQKICTGLDDET
jgi:hypothetical protein